MDPRERLQNNPFFVLGMAKEASRAELERMGQRLLAELAIGREAARYYSTPLGRVQRTEEAVRTAVAELRDPERRLLHEVWATLACRETPPPAAPGISWLLACELLGVHAVKKA